MIYNLEQIKKQENISKKLKNLLLQIDNQAMDIEFEIENINESDFVESLDYYLITNEKNIIEIKAKNLRSLYYALENYLVKKNNVLELKTDVKVRSYMLDISRGKIPSKTFFKKFIEFLSANYFNELQVYVEPNKKTKDGYWLEGYDKELIDFVQKCCEDNFIELVPAIASFSHLYDLVFKNSELRELTAINFFESDYYFYHKMQHYTLDPFKNESWEITKSILDFTLKNFKSKKINVCCDEPFDLTTKEFREKYKIEDSQKIYFKYIMKIVNYVKEKNKISYVWADVFCSDGNKFASCLSKEVIFLNWNYNSLPYTEQFKNIEKTSNKQILCGSDVAFGHEFLSYNNAFSNIDSLYNYFKKSKNSEGMMITHWGDYGHLNSIVQGFFVVKHMSNIVFNLKNKIFDENNPLHLLYQNLNILTTKNYKFLIEWMEQEKLEKEFESTKKEREFFFRNLSAFSIIDKSLLIKSESDYILKNWESMNLLPEYFSKILKEEVEIYRDICIINNNIFLNIIKKYYNVRYEFEPLSLDEIKSEIVRVFDNWFNTQTQNYPINEIEIVKIKYINTIETIIKRLKLK